MEYDSVRFYFPTREKEIKVGKNGVEKIIVKTDTKVIIEHQVGKVVFVGLPFAVKKHK